MSLRSSVLYLRDPLWLMLIANLLCTCDPAPEKLFQERFDTGVASINQLRPTEDFNIVEYLYYYNGGGVIAEDINGDSLPDLYFTNNQAPNKLYLNEGNWRFRDATNAGGVAGAGQWTTGVSTCDVNRDGRTDLYLCNVSGYKGLRGKNELFIQQPDGTFRDEAAKYGLDFPGFNTQAYWFDYDLDGDQDMYLLRHSVHNDATYGTAAARELPDSLAGDKLLRCDVINGRVSFVDVTAETGIHSSRIGYGLSTTIADFTGDGYPDIYVCNDFSENDYFYVNQGGRSFRESIRESFGHTTKFSMGSAAGDLDGDGLPDLISLDMRPSDEQILKSTVSAAPINAYRIKRRSGYYHQLPRNNVQWNRGGGIFSEVGELAGLSSTDWSWALVIEDFDLNGYPDVFVANGIERRPNDLDYLKFISSEFAHQANNLFVIEQMPEGRVANQTFANRGGLKFAEVDWGLGFVGSTTGVAVADLDGDGDQDLVINNVNEAAKVYENTVVDQPVTLPREEGASAKSLSFQLRDTFIELVADSLSADPFATEPLLPYHRSHAKSELTVNVSDGQLTASMWEPIRFVQTVNEDSTSSVIPGTEGWWQSLTVIDETPGNERIIAGNWGTNSALGRPTEEKPLRLYDADFDGNGKNDPVITYLRNGREYTLADKDELSAQLPSWRRNNLSYTEFSQRSFSENFPEMAVKPRVATTLEHHLIFRDHGGAWRTEPLPTATQITTLNAAAATPYGMLLGGNTLNVLPRIGRQDAAALQLLRPDGTVEFIDLGAGRNREEVKSIESLGTAEWLVVLGGGVSIRVRL